MVPDGLRILERAGRPKREDTCFFGRERRAKDEHWLQAAAFFIRAGCKVLSQQDAEKERRAQRLSLFFAGPRRSGLKKLWENAGGKKGKAGYGFAALLFVGTGEVCYNRDRRQTSAFRTAGRYGEKQDACGPRPQGKRPPLALSGPGTGGKAHRGGSDAKISGGPRGGDYIRAEVIWCLSQNRLNRF